MDQIVRVNMADLSAHSEPVLPAWVPLGGRALTSTIVAAEVPPTCHPLGPNNKLVFAPGLLTGTAAANSGRLSLGAKSPLTGGIKECNAGGTAGRMLAKLGIKALIVEGLPASDKWYSIHIAKDGITIQEETELLGIGNYCLVQQVQARFGKPVGVMSLGPAGEMKMLSANISVADPEGHIRSLGRGGLGAVMGAKRIKFISIDDAGTPPVMPKDVAKFKAAGRIFAKTLLDHPVSGQGLTKYGTNILVNLLHATVFRLGMTNVANEHYWTNITPGVSVIGYMGTGNALAQLGAPRTLEGTVSVDF